MYRTIEVVESILQMEIKSWRVGSALSTKVAGKFFVLGGPRPPHFEKHSTFIWKDSEIRELPKHPSSRASLGIHLKWHKM